MVISIYGPPGPRLETWGCMVAGPEAVGAVRSDNCGKVGCGNHDNRLTGRMGAPEQRALALWLGHPHPY